MKIKTYIINSGTIDLPLPESVKIEFVRASSNCGFSYVATDSVFLLNSGTTAWQPTNELITEPGDALRVTTTSNNVTFQVLYHE